MQAEGISVPPLELRDGVMVVDGFGVKIGVHRGHLVITDGAGRQHRRSRLPRATTKVKRIVVVGHTGSISLEALRWMADIGIDYVHLDSEGRILATSGAMGLDDPRLRRAQALASTNDTGLDITRWLLQEKLLGQLRNLRALEAADGVIRIEDSLRGLERAGTLRAMRLSEADAAKAYWRSIEDVPIRFARRDAPRLPAHWLRLGTRSSPLTGNPRRAASPGHAILNYLYAVLEAETRIACMKVGLDPGLGILHADQPSRDSMALDVMEPARPIADAELIRLVTLQVFRASDFRETRHGHCRVLAPLSHQLSRYSSYFAQHVGPYAEQTAQGLAGDIRRLPTHLSQTRRSAGRDVVRTKPVRRRDRHARPRPNDACSVCGTSIAAGRVICDACLPEHREEVSRRWVASGPEALDELRQQGLDPQGRSDVREKIGRKTGQRNRERGAWDRSNPPSDPAHFKNEILPRLQQVSPGAMSRASGLSRNYCSTIKSGRHVPHPRHWESLIQATQV